MRTNVQTRKQTCRGRSRFERTATISKERRGQGIVATKAPEPAMNRRDVSAAQTEEVEDADFIKLGQQLFAFGQAKIYHLRSVRGGRQCLADFVERYPPRKEVGFPTEWTQNTKAVNRLLERWMKAPNNPFNRPEEGVDWNLPRSARHERSKANDRSVWNERSNRRERSGDVALYTERAAMTEHRATEPPVDTGVARSKSELALAAAGEAALAAVKAKMAAVEAAAKAVAAVAAVSTALDEGEEKGGSGPAKKAESLTRFYTTVYEISPEERGIRIGGEEARAPQRESNAETESNYGDAAELEERWSEELDQIGGMRATGPASESDTGDTDYGSCGDEAELEELWRSDAFGIEEPDQIGEMRFTGPPSEAGTEDTDYGSLGDETELEELWRSDAPSMT
jgi:hypothetical protein